MGVVVRFRGVEAAGSCRSARLFHCGPLFAPGGLGGQAAAGKGGPELLRLAARWRSGAEPGTHLAVCKHALRSLARRHQQLTEEITDLDHHLTRLVTDMAPNLIAVKGLGPLTSAALLPAVGDNPDRLRSESAFAHLCGVAPVPASSGKTSRYRLNRGGNRQANYALYILAVTRMAWDPRTRAYAARRRSEGKTTKEIIRCFKRHIVREIYRLLVPSPPAAATATTPA